MLGVSVRGCAVKRLQTKEWAVVVESVSLLSQYSQIPLQPQKSQQG